MLRCTILAIAIVVGSVHAQDDTDRLPVPEAADRAKAQKEVGELFKADLAKSKGAARTAVAGKVLDSAKEAKEAPATRWALFELAQQTAIQAGDIALTLRVVDEKAKVF